MGFSSPTLLGWVIGGVQPVALAADWMVSAWDQPTYARRGQSGHGGHGGHRDPVDQGSCRPAREQLGRVRHGTTVAHIVSLATARSAVLAAEGWDATGQDSSAHRRSPSSSARKCTLPLIKALGVVGLGRHRVVRVPVDDQGRMRADAFPDVSPQRSFASKQETSTPAPSTQ